MNLHAGKPERRYINIGGRPGDLPFSDAVLVGDVARTPSSINRISSLTSAAACMVRGSIPILPERNSVCSRPPK